MPPNKGGARALEGSTGLGDLRHRSGVLSMVDLVTFGSQSGWTRLGSGDVAKGPSNICILGSGGSGKTRFAASAPRACPSWFGKRAVYIAIDPENESLGSILQEDRPNLEVIQLNKGKDLVGQVLDIYGYPWMKEGIQLCITDTMTVLTQYILARITDSGAFSQKAHIELGGGVKQPIPGDFLATQTLLFSLLRKQTVSGMHHMTLFHEVEVRPEPGQPGEPIGGPATVGKASIRSIVNWYNTVLHLVKRQKARTDLRQPVSYERVVHTEGHGIWQAKLRTPEPTNSIPELVMDPDPVNVWRKLDSVLNGENH